MAPKKKIKAQVKLQVNAGAATPGASIQGFAPIAALSIPFLDGQLGDGHVGIGDKEDAGLVGSTDGQFVFPRPLDCQVFSNRDRA